MDPGSLTLTLDDVSALFEQPATAEEHCRRFAAPILDKLGASLCAVAIGPRSALHTLYIADQAGPVALQRAHFPDSAALDDVFAGRALAIDATGAWPEHLPFGPDDPEFPTRGTTLILPLPADGGVGGLIAIAGAQREFDAGLVRKLKAIVRIFSLALTGAQLNDEVLRLSIGSTVDELTGLLNRGAFFDRLRGEWRRATRGLSPIALGLFDVDFFARYNDAVGQHLGDRALCAVAKTIADAGLRASDFAARYDGTVFAVAMPGAEEAGALALCDRIREAVASRALEHCGSPYGVVTVSAGVAALRPSARRVPATLIYEADAALFRAKQAGRNRVASKEELRTSAPATPLSVLPPAEKDFRGRDRELAELAACSDALVTIAGPAAIGKTALALEFARRSPIRAVFVELRGSGSASVFSKVAHALHVSAPSAVALAAALRDRVAHEPLIVVLDGCDGCSDGVAELVKTVWGITGLQLLVTKARPLELRGERVYALGPLA